MRKITVFHGSYTEITAPTLKQGRSDADFGTGFYVFDDRIMAEKWAARRVRSFVNEYEIDLDTLNGIEFVPDRTWLDFVVQNRDGLSRDLSEIDYIRGATADDKMLAMIERYEANLVDASEVLDSLENEIQTAIISEKGLQQLHFVRSYELSKERKEEVKQLTRADREKSNKLLECIFKDRFEKMNSITPELPPIKKKSRPISHDDYEGR